MACLADKLSPVGLRYADFQDIIRLLKDKFGREIGPKSDRPSSVRYADWVIEAGGKVTGSHNEANDDADTTQVNVPDLDRLRVSNDRQMTRLFELLRNQPVVIHW